MNKYERRHKILSSAPVTFVMYSVTFGLIVGKDNQTVSWQRAIIEGTLFGLAFTFLTNKKSRQTKRLRNVPQTTEQWEMYASIRNGQLPKSKKLLKEMPAFLDLQELNARSALKSVPILVMVAVGCSLWAVFGDNIVMGALAILDFALTVPYIHTQRKVLRNIASFREQLS